MAKITCDQIKLMELGSLCPIKDRDPNLIYAKFSTNEPTETVGFDELRNCLLKIDNGFDLLLVFVPGNNKFPPMYEAWVVATKEAFEKFNKASTRAREQKQYTEIARFINNCKREAEVNAAIGVLSNDQRVKRARFDEYTRKIGCPSLDSLVSPYVTNISMESFKNIIEIMYSVGYPVIWVGEGPKSDDDTILEFVFALQDDLLETIRFRATACNMWEMTIRSTIKCHFLKIAEMALPYSIISTCIKGYAAKQNNPRYIRCKNLEDYYVSALIASKHNPDIPEQRETMKKAIMPIADTLAIHNRWGFFIDDENACDKNIRKFIIDIVKMFPDEMDICVESDRDRDDIYSFSIKHHVKAMSVIFRPNMDNPYNPSWSVDIQSTTLIALFAFSVNKSIFDLIPSLSAEKYNNSAKATETNEPDKKDTSYERCADLQQYAIQCWRIDANPITKAIDKMLLARRMNRLIDLDVINVTFTERYTHDNDVRLFIAYIIKFYQGDMVSDFFKDNDGKCAFKYVHIEHPNMSVTFKPHTSDMNKWEIDIQCPELIALFSMAINVSIDKMFPLRAERAHQDFSGEMLNCYMKPIETTQYRDVPAPIVQRLVDKIHRMIETGSSITERIDFRRASNTIYGSQPFQALNCRVNMIREYTASCSNKAQLRIDGPLETTNATYSISFTPSDCIFKDLVLEAMGRVPLKP